jgi:hypothetical protein
VASTPRCPPNWSARQLPILSAWDLGATGRLKTLEQRDADRLHRMLDRLAATGKMPPASPVELHRGRRLVPLSRPRNAYPDATEGPR